MGDMGNDPARESSVCGHPVLNAIDHTQSAEAPSAAVPLGDQYASRHNGFVYFHSITDSAECDNVVNLNRLATDLKSEWTTPDFVFVTPNLCDDGHDGGPGASPCVTGQPGGLAGINRFLQTWIPMIQASAAYRDDGLIVINFDEGGFTVTRTASGETITAQGQYCCSEQPGPNLGPFPQSTVIVPGVTLVEADYGGDRTGAVLLSPLLKPGTVSNTPFNHFSLLKTVEDIFDTDSYLGYAGQPGLLSFFGSVRSDVQIRGDQ
jgi:hypothetical protein